MKLKNILRIFLWILFIGSFVTLVGFVEAEKEKVLCQGIRISLDRPDENSFLTRNDIVHVITQLIGDSVRGKPMKEISISLIRERLEENEYIRKAVVYATVDGWIVTDIRQRSPVIRVQNLRGEHFYLSHDGRMIPVSFQYTARVPFASGHIQEKYDHGVDLVPAYADPTDIDCRITTLQKLYLLALALEKEPLIKAQLAQVYVNRDGEFEGIPILGGQVIQIGNSNDMASRLANLRSFYEKALPSKGWNSYKTINIKFSNQVICSKN